MFGQAGCSSRVFAEHPRNRVLEPEEQGAWRVLEPEEQGACGVFELIRVLEGCLNTLLRP